jgi:hypothetical protein
MSACRLADQRLDGVRAHCDLLRGSIRGGCLCVRRTLCIYDPHDAAAHRRGPCKIRPAADGGTADVPNWPLPCRKGGNADRRRRRGLHRAWRTPEIPSDWVTRPSRGGRGQRYWDANNPTGNYVRIGEDAVNGRHVHVTSGGKQVQYNDDRHIPFNVWDTWSSFGGP